MIELCYNRGIMSFLSSTIGHQTAQTVLLRLFADDRTPHALLIVGPSHVGKRHIARGLMHYLHQTDQPLEMMADVTCLVREIDEKTGKRKAQISVKQVRALTDRLSLSSMTGSLKIGFIEEAHRLSIGAANALLKTLEEPKGKTLMLLRAPNVESVPATVVSRCQCVRLSIVTKSEIAKALEKHGLGPVDAQEIAERSLGRPGLAIRYIQDSQLRAQKELASDQAHTLFSASLTEQFRRVSEIIPKSEADKPRLLARLLDDWSEAIRAEMLNKLGDQSSVADIHEVQRLARLLGRMEDVRVSLKNHINPHLALEHLFL